MAQHMKPQLAVIVTTPQEVALADVRKSIDFCRQVNMPILGMVENMNGMICPHCGQAIEFFKSGGGSSLAEASGLFLLGSVPFVQGVVESGDTGKPVTEPFAEMVKAVIAQAEGGAAA